VHPLVNTAFDAHRQIQDLIASKTPGVTPEIWALTELAVKIDSMKERRIPGLEERLTRLTSRDFSLYLPTHYEIQIGGMLLSRGYRLEFLSEGKSKSPDLLAKCDDGDCEIECKQKQPDKDNLDSVRSIYNRTRRAGKQF
jgi:hypothetical protein